MYSNPLIAIDPSGLLIQSCPVDPATVGAAAGMSGSITFGGLFAAAAGPGGAIGVGVGTTGYYFVTKPLLEDRLTDVFVDIWVWWKGPSPCSEATRRVLQANVNFLCKGPASGRRCHIGMTCREISGNMVKFQACARARQTLMDRCFNGGDEKHQDKADDYRRAAGRCLQVGYDNGCWE